jgi:aldose 1-epimerase
MKVHDARCKILSLTILVFISSSLLWAANRTESSSEAAVESSKFGTLDDGQVVELYTLKNAKGATAKVITYGAILTELWVPDRSGKLGDVVLGFDNLQGYVGKHPWFGATVGRVANRVAKGKFTLDGKEYSLEINDPRRGVSQWVVRY